MFQQQKSYAKKIFTFFVFLILVFSPFLVEAAGLVPCGGNNEEMCTLCHLIIGIKGLIDWGFTILVFIALLAIVIAGIMYIVSAGSDQEMEKAKNMVKQTLTGVAIILGAWLLINTTFLLLGKKGNLGIGVTDWNSFSCITTAAVVTPTPTPPPLISLYEPLAEDAPTLASSILSNMNITVISSGDCKDSSGAQVSPKSNLTETKNQTKMTTCFAGCDESVNYCTALASSPNVNMLKGLLTAASSCKFSIQSIAGGSHGKNSKHYKGNAVDVTPISCSMQQLKDIFSTLPNKDGVICDVGGDPKPCSPYQSGMHVHASFN